MSTTTMVRWTASLGSSIPHPREQGRSKALTNLQAYPGLTVSHVFPYAETNPSRHNRVDFDAALSPTCGNEGHRHGRPSPGHRGPRTLIGMSAPSCSANAQAALVLQP